MRYIFENGNSNKDQQKKTNNSKYTLWMNSILRRSKEIGKVELPICSIILDERGRCIGRGVNRRNINKDPLGHAEIMALRQASLIKNDWRFNECTIITNLEPCTMCSSALIQARMGKVIFGAYDKKRGGLGGSIDLSKHESAHHKMEIIGGILETNAVKFYNYGLKVEDSKIEYFFTQYQIGLIIYQHSPHLN